LYILPFVTLQAVIVRVLHAATPRHQFTRHRQDIAVS